MGVSYNLVWPSPHVEPSVDHTRSCKIDVVTVPQIGYIFDRSLEHTMAAVPATTAQ
jgi:hypothetical protein